MEKEIVIEFNHLRRGLRKVIAGVKAPSFDKTIKDAVEKGELPSAEPFGIQARRGQRIRSEAVGLGFGAAVVHDFVTGGKNPVLLSLASGMGFYSRQGYVARIQKDHDLLSRKMMDGIIRRKESGKFPNVDFATLSRTHPIFYIDQKSRVHFLPMSGKEFAIYELQKDQFGKVGLNPWAWRGYLVEPEFSAEHKQQARKYLRFFRVLPKNPGAANSANLKARAKELAKKALERMRRHRPL